MKIGCIDKTATDRLRLQRHVEDALERARPYVGHLPYFSVAPMTVEEFSFGNSADVVVLGPSLSVDETYKNCRAIRAQSPDTPCLVFLSDDVFSFRTLNRFDGLADDIFSISENETRFVFSLAAKLLRKSAKERGRLVTIQGVKGGVGGTSLATGLVHAANALDRSALLIDLSEFSILAHYMGCARLHSPEYCSTLTDGTLPDEQLAERMVSDAPNGVSLLLSPSGGREVRELWLRDHAKLEVTLALLDLYSTQYDLIVVDLAGSEGVLPFALQARADVRVLLSSNDPSAIHLLGLRIPEAVDLPAPGTTTVVINRTFDSGLSQGDIRSFLQHVSAFDENMMAPALPFDARARAWIGTGNTFYTEAGKPLRTRLEQIAATVLGMPVPVDAKEGRLPAALGRVPLSLLNSFKRWSLGTITQYALPAPPGALGTFEQERAVAGSNNSLLAPIYLGDGHDSREHLRPDYMSAPIEQRTVEQDTASMSRYGSTYRQPSDAPSSYAELSHTAPIRDDGDRDCPFTDYYRGPSADAQGAERDRARNSHAGSYTAGTVQSPGTVQAAGTRAAASSGSERRDSARQAATPSIPSIKAPVPAAPGGEGLNKSALSYSAPVMVNDGRPRRTAANGSSIPASDATNSRRAATGGGQRGSLTLEQLLVAAVAILCGITLFPHLQRSVADYSYRFQEIPQTRQFP